MADLSKNTIIEKTFTYDVPDDYLSTERTLNKTATHTYTGPNKIWVFIDNETNKYVGPWLTEAEDGADVPTPLHKTKVMVDCETDPIICQIIGADILHRTPYDDLEQHSETLPCGSVYTRVKDTPPDHTHDHEELEWSSENQGWILPGFREPHVTWHDLRKWRNGALGATDSLVPDDAPESHTAPWVEFRQKLRDMPQVHGAVNVEQNADVSATGPANTPHQYVIKMYDVTGIKAGMWVSNSDWQLQNTLFEPASITTVVSVDPATKLVTLSTPIIRQVEETNKTIKFHGEPTTPAFKWQPIPSPDGTFGT